LPLPTTTLTTEQACTRPLAAKQGTAAPLGSSTGIWGLAVTIGLAITDLCVFELHVFLQSVLQSVHCQSACCRFAIGMYLRSAIGMYVRSARWTHTLGWDTHFGLVMYIGHALWVGYVHGTRTLGWLGTLDTHFGLAMYIGHARWVGYGTHTLGCLCTLDTHFGLVMYIGHAL